MIGYKITDEEGWNVDYQRFENKLKDVFPDYKLCDSRDVGQTVMKAYGVFEEKNLIGRIDVSYRPNETAVLFSGEKAKGLVEKLTSDSNFEWNTW